MIGSKFVAASILAAAAVGSMAIAVAQTQPGDTSRTPDAAVCFGSLVGLGCAWLVSLPQAGDVHHAAVAARADFGAETPSDEVRSIADKRITYGCINLPTAFFERVVAPMFARRHGVVYVLPEVKSLRQVFGVDVAALGAGDARAKGQTS